MGWVPLEPPQRGYLNSCQAATAALPTQNDCLCFFVATAADLTQQRYSRRFEIHQRFYTRKSRRFMLPTVIVRSAMRTTTRLQKSPVRPPPPWPWLARASMCHPSLACSVQTRSRIDREEYTTEGARRGLDDVCKSSSPVADSQFG